MTDALVGLKYHDTALPTGGNTYTVFNTFSSGWPKSAFQMLRIRRIITEVNNDQAGTLNEYKSVDGVTWVEISTTSVSAAAANSTNINDYLVEPYLGYWKLEWVNGGVNQTKFDMNIAGTGQRNIGN